MHIYFGNTTDTEETFTEANKNYYYLLESDEDGIVLHDCCDRMFPLAIEEVPALITALITYMQEEGERNLLINALQDAHEEDNVFTID